MPVLSRTNTTKAGDAVGKGRCGIDSTGRAADVAIQLSGPKVLTLQEQAAAEGTSTEAEFR